MPFCTECGHQLVDGAKFCSECGIPVYNKETTYHRETIYEGKLHKCPSCGEMIGSFEIECPTCGHEFRNSNVSNSIREFARKLELIDSEPDSVKFNANNFLQRKELTENEQRKITLIRSFPIPNTKEDLLEFMILASSNIDVINWKTPAGQGAISGAWQAKFDQAYQKAKILFPNGDVFDRIESLYYEKQDELEVKKEFNKKQAEYSIAIIAAIASMIIFYFMLRLQANII